MDTVDLNAMVAQDVPSLLEQLTERRWTQRRAIVSALAQKGEPAILGLCAILARQRDDETRLASAVEALVASSGNAEPAVLGLITPDAPPPLLCDAVAVLGRRHSLRAIPTIERLASHPDSNVALAAIEALGRVGGGAGVDALIALVRARDFFRTFPAIEVLGKSRDARAVDLLIELLEEPLYSMPSARALGDTGDCRAVEPLVRALVRGDQGLVRACAVALARIVELQGGPLPVRLHDAHLRAGAVRWARSSWEQGDLHERAALAQLLGWLGGDEAVSALLDIAKVEEPISVATADALRSLGRQVDEPLLALIHESSSSQRRALLPLLGGAPTGIAAVTACLRDPDPEVRSAAADALARIGNVTAVDALFDALTDTSTHVVQACVAAIQSLGSTQTERRALAAANHRDIRVRRACLRIISYFGYNSGADHLIAAACDDDERIRDAAMTGLPFMQGTRARAALLAGTRHPSPQTRASATRALAQLPADPSVQEALARSLADPDPWVRYYACLSSGRLGLSALADAVITRLQDTAGQVRVSAIEALGQLGGEQARAALELAARSPELDLRRAAIVGLGAIGDERAVSVLLHHVIAEDPAARLMALSSLANYDSPQVVQALRRAAFDEDWSVRQSAISLLAARKDVASTQALIDLLDQRQLLELVLQALASHAKHVPYVAAALETANQERATALATVLARMRHQDAATALRNALQAPNVFARRAAVTALGTFRTPEARDALRRAAYKDLDPEVRARAAAAVS